MDDVITNKKSLTQLILRAPQHISSARQTDYPNMRETRWIIKNLLGQGAYGQIYLGCANTVSDDSCRYAVKIVYPYVPETRETISEQSILHEVHMMRACSPYSVPLVDYWLSYVPPDNFYGGVIITEKFDVTLRKAIENYCVHNVPLLRSGRGDAGIDEDTFVRTVQNMLNMGIKLILALHRHGYSHGDSHLDNIILKNVDYSQFATNSDLHQQQASRANIMKFIDFGQTEPNSSGGNPRDDWMLFAMDTDNLFDGSMKSSDGKRLPSMKDSADTRPLVKKIFTILAEPYMYLDDPPITEGDTTTINRQRDKYIRQVLDWASLLED